MRTPVIVAALAVLPLLALSLTKPKGVWHTVEVTGHWIVWLVFAVEVTVMLAVVKDRRAWMSSHRFELLVVAVSSPLVPLALAVAVAPALRLLVIAKAFKTLKLAKAIKLAKLGKSVRLLRRKLTLGPTASLALSALALATAVLTALYVLTGSLPLNGGAQTVALVAAGMLATWGVSHLHRRASTDVARNVAG